MTSDLHRWLLTQRPFPIASLPPRREGRLITFVRQSWLTLHEPVYVVYARRGGFPIGKVEYRNQWNDFAFTADEGVPMNLEILGEIYAGLRDVRLASRGVGVQS